MNIRQNAAKLYTGYIAWYLAGAGVAFLCSIFQHGPGFMDAAYYASGGARIAQGMGWTEPFIWNYLGNPTELPQPAFAYWMPLPSLVAAVGMIVGQSTTYAWSKLGYILLAGCLPVLSVRLGKRLLNNPDNAWIAGGLAVFPGIYAVYISVPVTFTPTLLGGAVFITIAFFAELKILGSFSGFWRFLGLGLVAGWMHLSRADGIIWLGAGIMVLGWRLWQAKPSFKFRIVIFGMLGLLLGYVFVMGAWYGRNVHEFGTLFPPGTNRTLFLTDYNQTFAYPPDVLTPQTWLASGITNILRARLDALLLNLQNLLAVQGTIILLPLIITGFWSHRREASVRLVVILWIGILGLMTIIFPYAGSRGGYLHSASALQVFLWVMAVAGLEKLVVWAKRTRGWNYTLSMRVFGLALVALQLSIAIWFYQNRVIGDLPAQPVWNRSIELYQQVRQRLETLGFDEQDVGMVNNPPGFYWATGWKCIVIPDGSLANSLAAGRKFGATYLLLEEAQVNLDDLFQNPQNTNEIIYLETFEGVRIFRIPGK